MFPYQPVKRYIICKTVKTNYNISLSLSKNFDKNRQLSSETSLSLPFFSQGTSSPPILSEPLVTRYISRPIMISSAGGGTTFAIPVKSDYS